MNTKTKFLIIGILVLIGIILFFVITTSKKTISEELKENFLSREEEGIISQEREEFAFEGVGKMTTQIYAEIVARVSLGIRQGDLDWAPTSTAPKFMSFLAEQGVTLEEYVSFVEQLEASGRVEELRGEVVEVMDRLSGLK